MITTPILRPNQHRSNCCCWKEVKCSVLFLSYVVTILLVSFLIVPKTHHDGDCIRGDEPDCYTTDYYPNLSHCALVEKGNCYYCQPNDSCYVDDSYSCRNHCGGGMDCQLSETMCHKWKLNIHYNKFIISAVVLFYTAWACVSILLCKNEVCKKNEN